MQLRMNLVDRSDGSSTTVDLRAAAHHTLDDLLAALTHGTVSSSAAGHTWIERIDRGADG